MSSFDVEQAKNLSYIPLAGGFGRNKMNINLKIVGFGGEKQAVFCCFLGVRYSSNQTNAGERREDNSRTYDVMKSSISLVPEG